MEAARLQVPAVVGVLAAGLACFCVAICDATPAAAQAPVVLTTATAKARADEAVAARYGALWTEGTRKWSRCVDYTELLDDASVQDETWACYFDFKTNAGSYRFGSVSVDVTAAAVTTEFTHTLIYRYRPRRCAWRRPATALETVRESDGRLTETATSCFSARKMADDIAYQAGRRLPDPATRGITGMGGTGSAGWPEWSRFTCTLSSRRAGVGARRYDARCRNSLGWSFRAHFTVTKQRPQPRRRPRPTPPPSRGCDPNYRGACLRPDVSDYDCEGGRGNGPYYTGPVTIVGDDHYRLDANGDGRGCEDS